MIKKDFSCHSISDFYYDLVENSELLNIATGFVSNAAIFELDNILRYRQNQGKKLTLNLLIGMDYINHFTKKQYLALKELHSHVEKDRLGTIMVSKQVLYHGKMYSFVNNETCDNAFIGSSNLGSFIGTSDDLIESDVLFHGQEAATVNKHIEALFKTIGTDLKDIPEITEFKDPVFNLLDDNRFARKIPRQKRDEVLANSTEDRVVIPIKDTEKSNLNTSFGAGKTPNRWSPRDWFEVEIIVSEKKEFRAYLDANHFPKKQEPFTVVTEDGYTFECMLQGGTKGKNLRSLNDLRVLGKWIKGHMEAESKLRYGELVTKDIISDFGKDKLVFTRTYDNVWYLTLE